MDPERKHITKKITRQMRTSGTDDLVSRFFNLGIYTAAAAVITYILHTLMARFLTRAEYASYGTFVSLLFAVLFSVSGIYLVIMRFIAYHRSRHQFEEIHTLVKHGLRWLFMIGGLAFLVILLFARQITIFFQMESVGATVIFGIAVWFTVMIPVYEGAFKGWEQLKPMGLLRLVEAVGRWIICLLAVTFGFGLVGAIFGLGVGTFISLAFCYVYLHKLSRVGSAPINWKALLKSATPVFLAMLSFALLVNVDVLLVTHYFPSTDASVYVAASLFAKISYFVAMLFIGLTFGKVTQLHASGKKTAQVLINGVAILTPIVLVLTLLCLFFSGPIFRALFGSGYEISSFLSIYVFGSGCLSIAAVFVAYLLALKKDKVAWMLPMFVLILILGIIYFHTSLVSVMLVHLFTMTLLIAYTIYFVSKELDVDVFLLKR